MDSLTALLVDAHQKRDGAHPIPAYHELTARSTGAIARSPASRSSPTMSNHPSHAIADLSDIGHSVAIANVTVNHSGAGSVEFRLSQRWGVKPETARWMLYHMSRGLRGRILDALDEFGADCMSWFAPILEKFYAVMGHATASLHDKTLAFIEDERTTEAYRQDPSPVNRRKAYLATEKASMAGLAYAAVLRAQEEAERP